MRVGPVPKRKLVKLAAGIGYQEVFACVGRENILAHYSTLVCWFSFYCDPISPMLVGIPSETP